jgi:hypothetical protein
VEDRTNANHSHNVGDAGGNSSSSSGRGRCASRDYRHGHLQGRRDLEGRTRSLSRARWCREGDGRCAGPVGWCSGRVERRGGGTDGHLQRRDDLQGRPGRLPWARRRRQDASWSGSRGGCSRSGARGGYGHQQGDVLRHHCHVQRRDELQGRPGRLPWARRRCQDASSWSACRGGCSCSGARTRCRGIWCGDRGGANDQEREGSEHRPEWSPRKVPRRHVLARDKAQRRLLAPRRRGRLARRVSEVVSPHQGTGELSSRATTGHARPVTTRALRLAICSPDQRLYRLRASVFVSSLPAPRAAVLYPLHDRPAFTGKRTLRRWNLREEAGDQSRLVNRASGGCVAVVSLPRVSAFRG